MTKKAKKSLFSTFAFKLLLIITIAALAVYVIKYLNANSVLGTSTFLADKGSDSSQSSNNSENDQNDSQQENSVAQEHATEPTEAPQHDFKALNKVVFETENHEQIKLGKSTVEISSEGGHLKIKAKSENGLETELENDSLDKINHELENEDIEISTDSSGFHLRHGQFEAQTHFPLSINPVTNELTVTTPAGTKTVTILPDQAVNNLINQKFITVVASTSATTGINLTEFENNPAFEIHGKSIQKLFGFFPIGIDKTGVVSAETGQVLQVSQSFLSRLFDLLSVN